MVSFDAKPFTCVDCFDAGSAIGVTGMFRDGYELFVVCEPLVSCASAAGVDCLSSFLKTKNRQIPMVMIIAL